MHIWSVFLSVDPAGVVMEVVCVGRPLIVDFSGVHTGPSWAGRSGL